MCMVVNSKMDRSASFSSFANCVIVGNNLLEGTPVRLSVNELLKPCLRTCLNSLL